MAVRGIFMSNQSITGDRVQTFSGRILQHGYGGTAPLLALSSGMAEEQVSDTAWSWTEDQHISGNTTTTTNYNTAATDLTVVDSNIWVPQTILMVEATGERMLVTAVVGNVVTVVRGLFGSTAQAIANAARLQSIGTAFPEAGGKPAPVTQFGETYTNLVQIFKNGWALSGTAKAVKYAAGSKLAYNKQHAIQYHAEDIERAFIFGARGQAVINNQEYRVSDGVINMISQYGGLVQSAAYGGNAGTMALAGLQSFMRLIFDRQIKGMPNERIAFTSSLVLELIQTMARKDTHYELTVKDTQYGFSVSTLNFLGNKLDMMTHPMFVENATWAKQLLVLHPGLIKKKILRPTWTEEFGAARSNNAGIDAEEGFVAEEIGFHLSGARTMGLMTNITTGVAS